MLRYQSVNWVGWSNASKTAFLKPFLLCFCCAIFSIFQMSKIIEFCFKVLIPWEDVTLTVVDFGVPGLMPNPLSVQSIIDWCLKRNGLPKRRIKAKNGMAHHNLKTKKVRNYCYNSIFFLTNFVLFKGDLMMLSTDLALVEDPKFREWAEKYYKDEALWMADFAKYYQQLNELGCKSLNSEVPWYKFW